MFDFWKNEVKHVPTYLINEKKTVTKVGKTHDTVGTSGFSISRSQNLRPTCIKIWRFVLNEFLSNLILFPQDPQAYRFNEKLFITPNDLPLINEE